MARPLAEGIDVDAQLASFGDSEYGLTCVVAVFG